MYESIDFDAIADGQDDQFEQFQEKQKKMKKKLAAKESVRGSI